MADLMRKAPMVSDLKKRAKRRMPKFAFDYLVGGTVDDTNLDLNLAELAKVHLEPRYLDEAPNPDLSTTLLGKKYDMPIGVAPIGLGNMQWPMAAEYLAAAANKANIPFILSTMAAANLEEIAEIAQENFWFQLYPPVEEQVRKDFINRIKASGCKTLVVTIDIPTHSYRPRDVKNGLAMPPKLNLKNVYETLVRPQWLAKTLIAGLPEFKTLKPYIPATSNMKELGHVINSQFTGATAYDPIKGMRDMWDGTFIVKGVNGVYDAKKCLELGADAIVVSNHGGRVLDAAKASINVLPEIRKAIGDKMAIIADSGVRSGDDIARFIASGADFVLAGRPFMYGVGAFGKPGADHIMEIFHKQLDLNMRILKCNKIADLPSFLIKD